MSTSQDTKTADRHSPPSPAPAVVSERGLGPQETTSHRGPWRSYHEGRGDAYTLARDARLAWLRRHRLSAHAFEPGERVRDRARCDVKGCGLIRSHIVHDHDLFETPEQTKQRVGALTKMLRTLGVFS